MIFCSFVTWQQCSSGTDLTTNLICDAAWCEDLWVVVTCRGRRKINDTQTDNYTSEGQYGNTEKRLLSPEKDLMLWEREGMSSLLHVFELIWIQWQDCKPTPCLNLCNKYKIMMLRWHHCAQVNSVSMCRVTHHGELGLQFFDPVLLHVHLRAQGVSLFCGFFGLPPQVPLLPLQHILLLCQGFYCILTLLKNTHKEKTWLIAAKLTLNDRWTSTFESRSISQLHSVCNLFQNFLKGGYMMLLWDIWF